MTQQRPDGSANEKYKRKLFVECGVGYVEVKARIIEPYQPPMPAPTMKELKIINAPSHFMSSGLSSYKAVLNLFFTNKEEFSEYLMYSGWTHKFYDEKGHIFVGGVEAIKITSHEAQTKYIVEISLLLVKKSEYGKKDRFQFQDTDNLRETVDIEEMANLGLISVVTRDGQPEIYFRPNAFVTRAEFVTFLNRTRRFIESSVRE